MARRLSNPSPLVFRREWNERYRSWDIQENAQGARLHIERKWYARRNVGLGYDADYAHYYTLNRGKEEYRDMLSLEQLDRLIDWKVQGRIRITNKVREGQMQDQITIEIRIDFEDKEKVQQMRDAACAAARKLLASAKLLGPRVEPTAAVFTDDFMAPADKLSIYADLDGKPNENLSDEMLHMLKEETGG